MRKPVRRNISKRTAKPNLEFSRAMIWAGLSLTAYLIAFILAVLVGAPGPLPFAYGGFALLLILVSEAALRGKLWIFEPTFNEIFGHPQIAHRLTYFSVGLVLALESSIILGFIFFR
jgi:hypothetical protein